MTDPVAAQIRAPTPMWHSLMYSTGYLLLFCRLPCVPVLVLLCRPIIKVDPWVLGLCLLLAKACSAGLLLESAHLVFRRSNRAKAASTAPKGEKP